MVVSRKEDIDFGVERRQSCGNSVVRGLAPNLRVRRMQFSSKLKLDPEPQPSISVLCCFSFRLCQVPI